MNKRLYRGRPDEGARSKNNNALIGGGVIAIQGSNTDYFTGNASRFYDAREGDVIFQVVGVVKKREATKVAKPFEVGKNYTIDGTIGPVPHRVLAITDKYIVTQHPSVENSSWALLWHLDGKRVDDANNRLIPEYEEKGAELYVEKVEE